MKQASNLILLKMYKLGEKVCSKYEIIFIILQIVIIYRIVF